MARFIINPKVNNTLGLMDVITVPQGGTGVTVAGSVPGVFNAFVGSDLNTANGPIGLDGNGKIPVQYFPTGAGGVLIYDSNGFVPNSAISPSSGVGVFTGITGPSSVVVGETVTYTITNYDSFLNYSVTVSGGSASVSGNLISFTAPTTTGTVTLTLNGKTSSIPVIASRVNAPVITAPGNNAESVSLKPTFTKSAFSVTGQAQTQTRVRWELSTDPAFTTLVDYYEGASNYTSWTPSVTLSNLTTYYVRVKDQGNISGYSAWSPVVSFTTVQQVNFVTTLGGSGDDQFWGIVKVKGYLYAVGYQTSQGQGNYDALIVKYDTNGNLIWQRGLGGSSNDIFYAITTDGTSIYAAGYQASQDQGNYDALIVKYDTNGNLIWQRGIGGGSNDLFFGITTDGTYLYASGYQYSQTSGNNATYLVKYDLDGNLIWQRSLDNSGSCHFRAIVTDGAYLYLGGIHGLSGYGVPWFLFIAKYDKNGNVIWQKRIDGTGFDQFYAITTDGTYFYAVGSQNQQTQGSSDAYLIKYDANGNVIWQYSLGGTGSDYFSGLTVDGNMLYAVGYQASQSQGSNDALLVALPTSGSITLGPLTGANLTGLSWRQTTLAVYNGSLGATTPTLIAYTPTLTAYTPTLTSYTPTLVSRYSNF